MILFLFFCPAGMVLLISELSLIPASRNYTYRIGLISSFNVLFGKYQHLVEIFSATCIYR